MRTYSIGADMPNGDYAAGPLNLMEALRTLKHLRTMKPNAVCLTMAMHKMPTMVIGMWPYKASVHYTIISSSGDLEKPIMRQSTDLQDLMHRATTVPLALRQYRNVIWMWSKGKEPMIIFDSQFDRT